MLITQREEQKGGYWSRLLSLAGCLSLSVSLSDSLFLFWAHQNQNFPNENKWARVNPLDSNCLQGLTHLSEPATDGWNEGGCHDNNSATLSPACVLWERMRQRLSRCHQGLFSPCCPGEIVPLEHTNGLVEVISLNLPDASSNIQEVWFCPIYWTFLLLLTLLMAFSEHCPLAVVFWPPEKISSAKVMRTEQEKAVFVIMAPCYPGSVEQKQQFSQQAASRQWSFLF